MNWKSQFFKYLGDVRKILLAVYTWEISRHYNTVMQLAGYSNIEHFNKGGMATLYTAQQESLGRTVVIKLLSAEFLWDEQVKQFFDQESLVIARLTHPNIIHIIDRGISPKGRPYFVMEYVKGQDLSERMNQTFSINQKLHVLLQICKAMSFAHKNGVIHRDIKPANILVDGGLHVTILDFGIAWLESQGKPDTQAVVGTPDYMSPEQFSSPTEVTHSSDIYSLGVLMYQMFSGELPRQHFNDLASVLSALHQDLRQLILACLNEDPSQRPASADAIRFELLKVLKGAHLDQQQKQDAAEAIGKAAEHFQLLDVLNQSRFGGLYLFEDQRRQQLIVVKKRLKSIAGLAQAKRLQQIKAPGLMRVLGTSSNQKAFIVVMEYLKGGSLQDRCSRPYKLEGFLDVAIQLCQAMQAAHDQHLIHGDLRPSNILFDEQGRLHVSDFGFDTHYQGEQKSDWYHPQALNQATVEDDLQSAGLIFYRMLTGQEARLEGGHLLIHKPFKRLVMPVQKLLLALLDVEAPQRITSFSQMLPLLRRIQQEWDKQKRRRWKWWQLGLILLLVNGLMIGLSDGLRSNLVRLFNALLSSLGSFAG